MTGYTRQSTISDGETSLASLWNNEYNQLLAAFDRATGHKHDGTAAEGPVIGLIGDAGVTTPLNKIVVNTASDTLDFYVEVSAAAVKQLSIGDGYIYPTTTLDIDLGSGTYEFNNIYSVHLISSTGCTLAGTSGNVGVGVTYGGAFGKLHVRKGGASSAASPSTQADTLVVESNSHTGITLMCASGLSNQIIFAADTGSSGSNDLAITASQTDAAAVVRSSVTCPTMYLGANGQSHMTLTGGSGSTLVTFADHIKVNDEFRTDYTVTAAATTGAQTINKTSGSVNFAAGATSLVVTNSFVSSNSRIMLSVASNDTTMKSVAHTKASGSFTIYPNAAPTAETRVDFFVIN